MEHEPPKSCPKNWLPTWHCGVLQRLLHWSTESQSQGKNLGSHWIRTRNSNVNTMVSLQTFMDFTEALLINPRSIAFQWLTVSPWSKGGLMNLIGTLWPQWNIDLRLGGSWNIEMIQGFRTCKLSTAVHEKHEKWICKDKWINMSLFETKSDEYVTQPHDDVGDLLAPCSSASHPQMQHPVRDGYHKLKHKFMYWRYIQLMGNKIKNVLKEISIWLRSPVPYPPPPMVWSQNLRFAAFWQENVVFTELSANLQTCKISATNLPKPCYLQDLCKPRNLQGLCNPSRTAAFEMFLGFDIVEWCNRTPFYVKFSHKSKSSITLSSATGLYPP